MRNFEKLSLEYSKLVNNRIDLNLICDEYHSISKDMFDREYYIFDEYIGFDIESLDFYEDWLSGDKRRY